MEKSLSLNTNPFFQYVSNSKNVSVPSMENNKNNNSFSIPNTPADLSKVNQRKNSDNGIDPRKFNQNYMNKMQQLQNKIPKMNLQYTETGMKKTHPPEVRQKRSRSREKSQQKNRQRSQQSSRRQKQKKEQHYIKTKMCPLFQKGECKRGQNCNFAHGQKQLRIVPNFTKTRLCLAFKQGKCSRSSVQCTYAHGQQELRSVQNNGEFRQGSSKHSSSNNSSKFTRNDHKNHTYDNKKHSYRRDSQSIHRKQKHHKKSQSRGDSRDERKHKQSKYQKSQFFKKTIPVNKQYEKFLYGDLKDKEPQFNSSAYILPTENGSNLNANDAYNIDAYMQSYSQNSINPAVSNPSSINKNYNLPLQKDFPPKKQFASFNYGAQNGYKNPYQSNGPSTYPLPNMNSQKYFYQKESSNFKNARDNNFHFQQKQSAYNSYRNPQIRQNFSQPFSKFSKDSYKNHKNFSSEQPFYFQKNNQKAFYKQSKHPEFQPPYFTENNQKKNYRDNSFSQQSIYSPSNNGFNVLKKQPQFSQKDRFFANEPFYGNEKFHNNNNNESFFNPSYKRYQNQPVNNYNNKEHLNGISRKDGQVFYQNNGIYNYPALDNTINEQIPKYPANYQKKNYTNSNLPNYMPKR